MEWFVGEEVDKRDSITEESKLILSLSSFLILLFN